MKPFNCLNDLGLPPEIKWSSVFRAPLNGNVAIMHTVVEIYPVWSNVGTAITKRLHMHVEKVSAQPPSDFGSGPDDPVGIFNLAPKATFTEQPQMLDLNDLVSAQKGDSHLFLWGWARYQDRIPATPPHVTRFCYELQPVIEEPANQMVMIPDAKSGLSIPQMMAVPPTTTVQFFVRGCPGRGNCMDEECKEQGFQD
jgi:hypothetical protein